MAGSMSIPIFFKAGCPGFHFGAKERPFSIKKGICNANCRIPPPITPMARPTVGALMEGARKRRAAIKDRFRNTGAVAGAAKCLRELRIPIKRASTLTRNM